MKSLHLFSLTLVVLAFAPLCYSQDPLPVLRSSWEFTVQKSPKAEVPQTGPAKQITPDDTMVARTAREFRTDKPDDPSSQTPDGRRSLIEKNEEEAKMAQPSDVRGVLYTARVRNEGKATVKIIFWEYRFTETSDPKNVTSRQFICSVNLKKGSEMDLSAFSTTAPTTSIDAKSLATTNQKPFDEKVLINRIEYGDDSVLQRGTWKLADVQKAVDRATSTPWGKEVCRAL